MNITIQIDGVNFEGFTEVSVSRSIETVSSGFSFVATNTNSATFPIKEGDSCKIFVNTTQVIDGFVEVVNPFISDNESNITISGRDRTSFVIDSSISVNTNFASNISLKNVIKQTLSKNGIIGIDVKEDVDVGTIALFKTGEIESAEIGSNMFDFLEALARKKQVLLTTDGKGNIVLARGSTKPIDAQLILKEGQTINTNTQESELVRDSTNRFNKVIVKSQANLSASTSYSTSTVADITAFAIDEEIQKGKTLVVIAETALGGITDAKNRAIWEINTRKARGFNYIRTITGFSFDTKDESKIWEPNKLIDVVDERWDIRARLLIKNVEYKLDSDRAGGITLLTLTLQNAYNLSLSSSKIIEQNTRVGNNFVA